MSKVSSPTKGSKTNIQYRELHDGSAVWWNARNVVVQIRRPDTPFETISGVVQDAVVALEHATIGHSTLTELPQLDIITIHLVPRPITLPTKKLWLKNTPHRKAKSSTK